MSQEEQEALAAEWAAQLAEEEKAKADQGGESKEAQPNSDEALAAQWAEALAADEEQHVEPATFGGPGAGGFASQAKEAEFKDMTEVAKQPRDNKRNRELDFILDIPLNVSAELGRTRLMINELLQLGQGSVIELNKLAGEPLELYVNGKLVARGEAVVINEKFGVRLTDIISPVERVKQLG
ncbi:MAG: flagellar motor switch protein FliN [Desulfovibrionaceae bacterium]|nr:flagellar motor switch protein FliN [Desulfovibrionaceae bacterium]